ncbi:hypothetical protein WMY93_026973 [Mugilogobius chulae]|uniref:C-type lectin domain-containing protein n=1 Tax=Mugilogobius chulae TaxID=88201 RepID=A0AAW0N0L6_9GOBI
MNCSDLVIYEYHFVNTAKTWSDAQQYCREHYTDLATIRNEEELLKLNRPSTFTGIAWIGMFDDPASWKGVMGKDANSWRWSVTGSTSTSLYQNWKSGEPNYNRANEECVFMDSGQWGDAACSDNKPFVCFTAQPGFKNYTFVSTGMSWENAQSYCRQRYTDLVMIEEESENTAVKDLNPSGQMWIGLYRQPWRWSDGSDSTFKNWIDTEPNNYGSQHCVAEKLGQKWIDNACTATYAFHCHRGKE